MPRRGNWDDGVPVSDWPSSEVSGGGRDDPYGASPEVEGRSGAVKSTVEYASWSNWRIASGEDGFSGDTGLSAVGARVAGNSGIGPCVSPGDTCPCWHACSKAIANSCILAKRFVGSLSRAFITTSSISARSAGTIFRNDGGGASVCFTATSVNVP